MGKLTDELINEELLLKLAALARLKLTEQELAPMVSSLREIFGHAASLNKIDTKDVEPLAHVHPDMIDYRDDESSYYEGREDILKNLPERSGAFIKVPLVIDSEG